VPSIRADRQWRSRCAVEPRSRTAQPHRRGIGHGRWVTFSALSKPRSSERAAIFWLKNRDPAPRDAKPMQDSKRDRRQVVRGDGDQAARPAGSARTGRRSRRLWADGQSLGQCQGRELHKDRASVRSRVTRRRALRSRAQARRSSPITATSSNAQAPGWSRPKKRVPPPGVERKTCACIVKTYEQVIADKRQRIGTPTRIRPAQPSVARRSAR
jgi:hypothetical protein